MADLFSLGASHRAEAEKAKSRTIFFAVTLVLVHLLDLKPSAAEALGLKVAIKDPVIIYGAIALLFGYQLSRFISDSNKGEAFLPLQVKRHHMRMALRMARTAYYAGAKKGRTPQNLKQLKGSARSLIAMDNVVLLPYRVISVLFILAAIAFMLADITDLAVLIWFDSPIKGKIASFLSHI